MMMKKMTALALALALVLLALGGAPQSDESAALAEQGGFSTRTLDGLLVGSAGGDAPASDPGGALLTWEGYSVQLLNYEIFKSSGGSAGLNLFARVVNDTDRKLSLWFNEATVDGVSVVVVPILGIEPRTDTGVGAPEKFYVFAPKENKQAASDAIASARALKGALLLRDADTDEVLLVKEVAVDLGDLEGTRNVSTPRPTDAPTPKPTPKPTAAPDSAPGRAKAPAYTPASRDFTTLKQGSRGQAVRDLQQRLTDLGYLNDKVDGSFGRNTATAVMSFNAQHSLNIIGDATPQMQALLYSADAEYYVEPYIPLVIGPTFRIEDPLRVQVDGQTGFFYATLVNRSPTRGIRGYVLSYYQTDMWGKRVTLAGGATQFESTEMNYVEPGHYKESLTYVVDNYYGTYAVYVGVQKIVFDDGEIRELDPDEITYFECAIQK